MGKIAQIKSAAVLNFLIFLKKRLSRRARFKLSYLRHSIFNIFSTILIETTTTCNRKCSYCPNAQFDRGLLENEKKMETELFHKIINELAELGWTGQIDPHLFNEPLMDERLPDLVAYARSKLPSCLITISTNGDFLLIGLYKKLVKSGVTEFLITQHQKEESANLRDLNRYREIHGTDNVKVTYEKLVIMSNRGGLVKLSGHVSDYKKCSWKLGLVTINYNGDVLFCCEDYFGSVKLGNLRNERLIDVWNKSYHKQLRKEVGKGIFNLELCKGCKYQPDPYQMLNQ